MDRSLKCQLCGKKLRVSPHCPCTLGEHLLAQHPDVDLTFFSSLENLCYWKHNSKIKREKSRKVVCSRKKSSLKVTKKASSGIYKTTVETWKLAQIELVCPRCRKRGSPCMRRNKNKAAGNSLETFCLLSCWPLCFLPFAMKRKSIVDLSCKCCGYFIGEYNRATGVLTCKCNSKMLKIGT